MWWMVSIIAWTQTTLKYGSKFQTKPPLGIRASDASDLLMVGYLLELLCDQSPFGANHKDEAIASFGLPTGIGPNLGVVVR
jgi:hypothetical protein